MRIEINPHTNSHNANTHTHRKSHPYTTHTNPSANTCTHTRARTHTHTHTHTSLNYALSNKALHAIVAKLLGLKLLVFEALTRLYSTLVPN